MEAQLTRIAAALERPTGVQRVELEYDLRRASGVVATKEKALAEDYLLNLAAGQQTWAAQKMAEVRFGPELRAALTEYEIALARLRRS